MAVYESALIDKEATDRPVTIVNPAESGGLLREYRSLVTFTTDHDDGDQVIVMRLPSNFAMSEFLITSDGNNTAGTLDIGIYTGSKSTGSWVLTEANTGSQDFIASAQAIATAIAVPTDIMQDGDATLEDRFQPLWQAIGLTSDPQTDYYIVAEVETGDIDADVKVGFHVRGVI